MTDTLDELEATSEKFSIDKLLDVRARTCRAVHTIASQVEAGMAEEEAKAIARRTLESLGMQRDWRNIIVQCGSNTTKDVDIGPIYEDREGDAGDTFVLGNDPDHHRAKRDARAIWEDTRQHVFEQGATGGNLYDYSSRAAGELG